MYICHVLEDPQMLQYVMELKIRYTLLGTRELAAENGFVSAALDILVNLRVRYDSINEALVIKSVSALLLLLYDMLQSKPKFHTEDVERSSKSFSDPVEVDVSLAFSSPATDKKPASDGVQKVSDNVFKMIFVNSTGYLNLQESREALDIACELIKCHVLAIVMQAGLQLTARLTKTHAIVTQFLETGDLSVLVRLPKIYMFPGFDRFASSVDDLSCTGNNKGW